MPSLPPLAGWPSNISLIHTPDLNHKKLAKKGRKKAPPHSRAKKR
jgi:hypothetical protein